MRTRMGLLAGMVVLVCGNAAAAEMVFSLSVQRGGVVSGQGLATAIAPDLVLASAKLIQTGDAWTVTNPANGAKLAAEIVGPADDPDLRVLRVAGLGAEPVKLARNPARLGDPVDLWRPGRQRTRGVVTGVGADGRLQYTGAVAPDGYGAPVFNHCGELLGLGTALLRETGRRISLVPLASPLDAVTALRVRRAVDAAGVAARDAPAACPSLEEQIEALERRATNTAADRERIDKLRNELAARNKALEQGKAEVEKALDQAKSEGALSSKAREAAERRARALEGENAKQAELQAKLKAELETEKRERAAKEAEAAKQRKAAADRQKALEKEKQEADQRLFILLGIAALLLLLVIVAAVILRRRQRALREQGREAERMSQELAKATVTHPDVVLQGRFPEGGEARIKVNGNALARSEAGLVLGRDPETCDLVLTHPKVSREHLRLSLQGGAMYLTDLSSSNGTSVNGLPLVPGQAQRIAAGDDLQVGGVIDLKVFVLTD